MALLWNLSGICGLECYFGVGTYEFLYLEEFYEEGETIDILKKT